ncbi:MAG: replication initiation protein [Defluviitaleaceae bacterium]|nr:replication initiation protein [Defluviitaleaceae bacterium]
MRQINEFTDINVEYIPVRPGRMTTHIEFHIQLKKPLERLVADTAAERVLDGDFTPSQMDLDGKVIKK